MRSKTTQRILDRTNEETKVFVKKHADLIVRINQLLGERGYTQRKLADLLEKSPSEINKWLKGEHNFTLRSICKLEVELGEALISVPVRTYSSKGIKRSVKVYNRPSVSQEKFVKWTISNHSGTATIHQ